MRKRHPRTVSKLVRCAIRNKIVATALTGAPGPTATRQKDGGGDDLEVFSLMLPIISGWIAQWYWPPAGPIRHCLTQ
jgi:hypothetical protein